MSLVTGEQLYLETRFTIERTIAAACRHHVLSGNDAEDFSAWVTARLIENDAAILRKFGGQASMSTYLAVVINNLLHDYRNAIWGRWRPSAAAVRLGAAGIRLEELIIRDGCPIRDAIGILPSGGVVAERDGVLLALRDAIVQLPAEDRLITRMRFWDSRSVADIASALNVEPKPLYRRIEGIARRLHGTLTRHGIAKSDVLELLAEDGPW